MSNKYIGLITLHNSYNYGAVLQSYSTYSYIRKIGFDNIEIIDYENDFESSSKKVSRIIFKGNFKDISKKIIQYIIFGKNRNLKKGFNKFSMQRMNYSPKIRNKSDLKERKFNYDIMISGSDQLWNPVIFGEIDDAYFLNFSNANKRISIATSAGSYTFSNNEKNNIKQLLENYDYISVREKSLKDQLQPLTKKDIFVSVDPTLLLSKEDWINELNIDITKPKEKYILLYIVDANIRDYKKEIKIIKQRLSLPIYMITTYRIKMPNVDKNIVSATPEKFLSLVNNATYVITNSYHGCIFSVNFRKIFFALENHKNPKRTYDFLSSIDLEGRIISNEEMAKKISIDFSYSKVENKLEKLIDNSKKWIKDSLYE